MTPRALFLDRDGVINREVGYLYRPDQVVFVDGIFSLCRTAKALGFSIVVITNQSGIARGFYSIAQFHALMDWMRIRFQAEAAPLDAVYFCPYHPEHGIGEYRCDHPDRKPSPGMLLRAASDLALALDQSILVGDRCSDIAAANAAGIRQAFLLSGTEPGPCLRNHRVVDTLKEVEAWLRDQAT